MKDPETKRPAGEQEGVEHNLEGRGSHGRWEELGRSGGCFSLISWIEIQ